MRKNIFIYLFTLLLGLFLNLNFCHAETYKGQITGTGVNLRQGPGTNYNKIKGVTKGNFYILVSNQLYPSEEGCNSGWYKIYYEGESSGYVCSNYIEISLTDTDTTDIYDRPWITPKAAIIGGAKFITESYIKAGQYTSYLKKFNVNPNGNYKVYNHQYMANLQAPYSEAYTSFKSYRDNNLLNAAIEFSIPIFENMPTYTKLPGKDIDSSCQMEVTDNEFEALLDAEGFPESYKCKLRIIHNTYSNWIFKAMHTNLDFNKSVMAEQSVSSIQGGDIYYDLTSGNKIETENNWYKANIETVAYYLDPRNFLIPERILMFEKLTYNANYTTPVVQSILNGTFMADYSLIDNQSYAEIFVEAGVLANISSVYLASLARQESGSNGSKATSGAEFTYKGITYKSLYNFYNIGANSSAESPILAGLVWASGGSTSVIVSGNTNNSDNLENMQVLNEGEILASLNASNNNNCLVGIILGTTLKQVKDKLTNLNVSIENMKDDDILKTGQIITISDGVTTFTYTIAIKGDVDGDGYTGATDYVKIKNYIMEKTGSDLNIAQSIAADADNNNEIGATDYVKIKNSIMEG